MAVSKSQQKAVHKYVKANYDRMELTIPKGQKDVIKAHAEQRGESTNGFVWRAVLETIDRDTGSPQEATKADGVTLITPDTLKAAQKGAQAAGEGLPQFIARAVDTQVQRDQTSLKLGINPSTGRKLEGGQ